MTERSGEVEQGSSQGPARISRRSFCKRAVAAGLGVAAVGAGVFMAAERLGQPKKDQASKANNEEQVVSNESLSVFGNWFVFRKANIDAKSAEIKPNLKPVFSKEGQQIGQVVEVSLEANPQENQASLDFIFNKGTGKYLPSTNGWQSWANSVIAGQSITIGPLAVSPTDKLVGMHPSYEQSLGGETITFYEPGLKKKISDTEGRSYGWVGFRGTKQGADVEDDVLGVIPGFYSEDVILGVIPSLDSLEGIRFKEEGDNIIVTVAKNLEGVSSKRPITFKVFLGQTPNQESKVNQADLLIAFSKELAKLVNIPLMKDRAIGFSWPVYGKNVTQADVQREVVVGRGIIDTYVIDDGWETYSGSLATDQTKFPNLPGLAKQMKELGIKPGIWVCPFKVTKEDANNLPAEWLMKDEHGKPRKIALPGLVGQLEGSLMLDISNPEVGKYLIDKLVGLAKMGFEVFKADFLAVPFTGPLQNKDRTSVEYYRKFFKDWRQSVRDELGKEIEIIGCGAPMMESIDLFEGIRYTPDSALPIETFVPFLSKVKQLSHLIGKEINTGLYKDALAVASRRILAFRSIHGLIFDGIHMVGEDVSLDINKRDRLNKSMMAFHRLGISNLFVGDSLTKVGKKGRQAWYSFISKFKMGNVEMNSGDRKLPKITEKYAPPKAV